MAMFEEYNGVQARYTECVYRAKESQARNDAARFDELIDKVTKHFKNKSYFVVHDFHRRNIGFGPKEINFEIGEYKLSPVAIICAFNNLLDVMKVDEALIRKDRATYKIRKMSFFK